MSPKPETHPAAITRIHPPPRLLLGVSLLFWGAMTNRPLIGLVLALAVEARHWTRVRWEFDDDIFTKTWHFTAIVIAIAAALIWLDGTRYTALPDLLSWMPLLLLPMQFVQTYGMRETMPLSTFSFLASRHRERNRRLGLIEETREFHFGNFHFVVTLLASTLGPKSSSWAFLPGIVILTGWMLLAINKRCSFVIVPTLAMAGLLAVVGEKTLNNLEEWIGASSRATRERLDPNFILTQIGKTGKIQQSPDIVWRIRPPGQALPPKLLRTASFNLFLGTNWSNHRVHNKNDFTDLTTRLIDGEPYDLLQTTAQSEGLETLPHFTLRGSADNKTPLPLPGDAAGLRDFALVAVESNTFGTVRVFPKHSIIDGTIFWNGGTNPESPPLPAEDLRIPNTEQETIHRVATDLALDRKQDLRSNLERIHGWLHKNFRYTRQLSIAGPAAISQFLTTSREGHCEYFATAATLLLRDAGIPARYAVGYAVMERDAKRGEYVIRGTHGHAWCRVWDETSGIWLDFDPTPPDWKAIVMSQPSRMQAFNDAVKRLRENFFIWRNRPANRLAVTLVMLTIGLAVTAFVAKRLWRSKRTLTSAAEPFAYTGPVHRTPLHDLEAHATKIIGERLPGQPFGQWLGRLKAALPEISALDEAIALHQRLRFDPEPPPPEHREQLAALAKQLHSALRGKAP